MAEKEYIEREAAINAMCRLCSDTTRDKCSIQDICNHVCRLEAVPAADVRPVVLCKDCYAYRRDKELAEAAYLDPEMYCGLLRCEMGEDSFCSYGKKREES